MRTHEPFLVGVGEGRLWGPRLKEGTQEAPGTTLVLMAPALPQEVSCHGLWLPPSCCWDTFVPVNKGCGDLGVRASGNTEADMENLRREATQPYVPSGTLERYFPPPLNRWVPSPHPLTCNPGGWSAEASQAHYAQGPPGLAGFFPLPPPRSQSGLCLSNKCLGGRRIANSEPRLKQAGGSSGGGAQRRGRTAWGDLGKGRMGNLRLGAAGIPAQCLSFLSNDFVARKGPHSAPAVKQDMRWKFTPMGRDAVGQVWYTGLTNSAPREAWYMLPAALDSPYREAHARWNGCFQRGQRGLPAGECPAPGRAHPWVPS